MTPGHDLRRNNVAIELLRRYALSNDPNKLLHGQAQELLSLLPQVPGHLQKVFAAIL